MEATVLQNKISRLLSTSYTDGGTRDALLALDDRVTENTAAARRSLRASTEAEVIRANGEALKKFAPLVTQIQAAGDAVNELNGLFVRMQQLVQSSKQDTRHVVSEGADLMAQQEAIGRKRDMLARYTDAFVLSDSEVAILRGENGDFDTFAATLSKAQRIHKGSEVLLASDDSRAGQVAMKRASEALEAASTTLARDTETALINYAQGESDSFRVDTQLRARLALLGGESRTKTLQAFAEVRRRQLLRSFTTALTEDSHATGGRALDFYAYDAQRYVGDVLAWVHAALASEGENTQILLGVDDPQLVDQCTSALCAPLRLRVERAVASQTRAPVAFRISGLVSFYRSMLAKRLPEKGALLETLSALALFCNSHFTKCAEARVRHVGAMLPKAGDLQPPEFLAEALVDVKDVLDANEQYSLDQDVLRRCIDNSTEPYIEFCRRMALDYPDTDAEIFLANCLDSVLLVLRLYAAAEYKLPQLEDAVKEIETVLTDRQHAKFVKRAGLPQNLEDVDLEPKSLSEVSFQLDDFLPGALTDAHSSLFRISSPRIVNHIVSNSAQRFVEDFSKLEELVQAKYKGDPEYKMFFPRTKDDVRLLLGVS